MDKFNQLTQFIIDCGVTGYYFVYFMIKNRPGLEDRAPLCLDNKPHSCCLHSSAGGSEAASSTSTAATSSTSAASPKPTANAGGYSPRTGRPQSNIEQQPFWRGQQDSKQNASSYVFQVGGVVQERRDQFGTSFTPAGGQPSTATKVTSAASSAVSKVTATSSAIASGIGQTIGSVGRAAGNVGYSVITSPITAAQFIRSSLSKFPVPSVPIPSFSRKTAAADDKSKDRTDSRASAWTPSEPKSVSPPIAAPSPPPPSSMSTSQAASNVSDAIRDLPHDRPPAYPSAFDGASRPSAFSSQQVASRPKSFAIKQMPATEDVITSPQTKLITQSQMKTTFRSAVPEFSSSYQNHSSSNQQQHFQPLGVVTSAADGPVPYKTREIRVQSQQPVSPKPQTQVKLRILSQEVHDLTSAAPPVPPHGPKPFVASSEFKKASSTAPTFSSGGAAPRMHMSMYTNEDPVPSAVITSNTSQSNIDWNIDVKPLQTALEETYRFSAQPFQRSSGDTQVRVTQTSTNWPPPSNAQFVPQEKDHREVITGRSDVATWAPTGDGAASSAQPQASPIPPAPQQPAKTPPPPPPRPRSISSHRTPEPENTNHPQDIARVLTSALADTNTTAEEIASKAESFSSRGQKRSQSESRWRAGSEYTNDPDFSYSARNPQGDVNDWQTATQKYGAVTTTMFSPEKSRDISQSLLASDSSSARLSRGADMFARRREKSEAWVHEPRTQEIVDTVIDAAIRRSEAGPMYSTSSNHSFSSSGYLASAPATPMSSSSHPLFSPSSDYAETPSSVSSIQLPQTRNVFSPERNVASNYNATPRDWKSYAAQYSRY